MHEDALSMDCMADNKVVFEPYVGVGPRRYVDFFSMNLGSGIPLIRKDKETGHLKRIDKSTAIPRLRMFPGGYLERESLVVEKLLGYIIADEDEYRQNGVDDEPTE